MRSPLLSRRPAHGPKNKFQYRLKYRLKNWFTRIGWCLLALIASLLFHSWMHPTPSRATTPPPSHLVQQGRDAYQAGQYTNAIAPLQQAVQTYTDRNAPLNRALALSYLALVYQELGDRPQAETAIQTSAALVPAKPDNDVERQLQAQVFNTQGELYFTWGQLENAIASWQTAAHAYSDLADQTGHLGVEINQIQALRALGYYRQAERRIIALQSQLDSLPDSVLALTAWRSLGNTLASMGRIQLSEGTRVETPNNLECSPAKVNRQFSALMTHPPQSPLAKGGSSGPPPWQGGVRGGESTTGMVPQGCAENNQPLTAQVALAKSLAIAQSLESPADIAAAHLSLGNVERGRGDRQLNQYLLSRYQSLVQQSSCSTQRIKTWSRSIRDPQTNPYQTALMSYDQALQVNDKAAPMDIQVRSRLNGLSLAIALAPDTVPDRVAHLTEQIQQLAPSRFAAYAHIHLAQDLNCWEIAQSSQTFPGRSSSQSPSDLYQQTPYHQSIDHLKTAIAMAQELGDRRAESYGWGRLGSLYAEQGLNSAGASVSSITEAKQATDRAMQIAQQIQSPDIAYRWQWQMGRLLRREQKWDEAIANYSQAFENLKALRSDLTVLDTDIQFSFREQIEPLYREFADLLLRSPSSETVAHEQRQPMRYASRFLKAVSAKATDEEATPHGPSQENLKQAREVLEALQLAELDNFFQDACSNVEVESLDRIIDEQSPTSAVLYTILLDETSSEQSDQRFDLVLKLPNDSLRYYSTPVKRSEVREVALDFRRQLTRPHTSQTLQSPAYTLYKWLIQPIEDDLDAHDIDHIVMVLDGVLRNVPIAALYDGQEFVGDRYGISLAPGLQLLTTDALAQPSTNLLAAGLSDSREGFPPLPNVETELEQITTAIPTATQLLNQQFTQFELETALNRNPVSILHLATHGQFSSQADDTFLLAYDDRIHINELHELLRNRNPQASEQFIDLLVLSACQTASGDERAALGLAGVAVRAGARSTLASLWSVDDQATALLVSEFYRQLYNEGQGLRKVEALQRAQQYVRDYEVQGIHPYTHPRYWAAFVLLGNWS